MSKKSGKRRKRWTNLVEAKNKSSQISQTSKEQQVVKQAKQVTKREQSGPSKRRKSNNIVYKN